MATLQRIAPTFPVSDLGVALAHFERLGFETRRYDGGDEYGFATRDGVEIHLGIVLGDKPTAPATAYLYVDDADELFTQWQATGADVRPPEDTPWGQHEGVVIDPDGNLIRFGSPIKPVAAGRHVDRG